MKVFRRTGQKLSISMKKKERERESERKRQREREHKGELKKTNRLRYAKNYIYRANDTCNVFENEVERVKRIHNIKVKSDDNKHGDRTAQVYIFSCML